VEKEMAKQPRLISASQVRRELGGITAQTEWRWRQKGLLPAPITIERRTYYRADEFEAACERMIRGEAAGTPFGLEPAKR